MADFQNCADALTEARRLLRERQYESAVALYEEAMGRWRNGVLASLNDLKNYQMHKEFLKCRIAFQMVAQQGSLADGFSVDYGDYLFQNALPPPIRVGRPAMQAIDLYKGRCGSIANAGRGVLERVAQLPHATTLIYTAHAVSADVFDLMMIARDHSIQRLAEFGCGGGLQAATLAKILPVQSVHLFEVLDYMQESACETFKANGLANYHMNRPLDGPVDGFYSFRACGFLFSVDAYIDQIRSARGPKSWALMDIGERFDAAHQNAQLLTAFKQGAVLYAFGRPPDHHTRILFDDPR